MLFVCVYVVSLAGGQSTDKVTLLVIHVCQQCELHTVDAQDFCFSFP